MIFRVTPTTTNNTNKLTAVNKDKILLSIVVARNIKHRYHNQTNTKTLNITTRK